ncbi:MAG: hypothetical protein AB1642_01260 [Pseudomonadota bacterium]
MKSLGIMRSLSTCFAIALTTLTSLTWASAPEESVALITALEGSAYRIDGKGRQPLQAFVKLKQGDFLALDGESRLQLVFFTSRRQELWRGSGRLEITAAGGRGLGLAEPQVKMLPEVLVKQIAKTPALDSQGRAGVVRLRAIATPEALSKLDNDYKRLRMEATRDDLNPEIFLLASLLEMRQFERLQQALDELKMSRPGNMEAGLLVALYKKSLKNLRDSGQ